MELSAGVYKIPGKLLGKRRGKVHVIANGEPLCGARRKTATDLVESTFRSVDCQICKDTHVVQMVLKKDRLFLDSTATSMTIPWWPQYTSSGGSTSTWRSCDTCSDNTITVDRFNTWLPDKSIYVKVNY